MELRAFRAFRLIGFHQMEFYGFRISGIRVQGLGFGA